MNRARGLSFLAAFGILLAACVPPIALPPAPPGGILTVAFLDIGQGD